MTVLRHPLLDFTTDRELATWCGVSLKTARLWRSGRRRPSRVALRLIGLHRQERVLCGAFEGFAVRGQDLVDPHGNTVSRGCLLAYVLVMQYAAALARDAGPEAQARFYQLLGQAG